MNCNWWPCEIVSNLIHLQKMFMKLEASTITLFMVFGATYYLKLHNTISFFYYIKLKVITKWIKSFTSSPLQIIYPHFVFKNATYK